MYCPTILAKAIGCLREGNTYQERWEKNYDSHVTRALYRENAENIGDQKTIVNGIMCEKAKIWANTLNKSVLDKAGSKTTLSSLHKFVLFHLMENIPFDLPHTIYINILRNLKGLGGLDDIYYVALINKMLWDQGVHHVFNNIDDDSKHTLIAKGSIIAKQ